MFDRFTERARKVMTLARQEAQDFRHDYIGTEHILLGLAREGSGVGAQVLKNLDVDLRRVRAEVERLVEQGKSPVSGSQLPFTPRAKRVLELAMEEAQALGHDYIGTEHLLLGLIRESDGPAARVLLNLGATRESVRREVADLLGNEPAAEVPPSHPRTGFLARFGGMFRKSALDLLTPGGQRILDLAREEALRLRNDYIGTEHLLVALLLDGEGVASRVLADLGLDLGEVRAEVVHLVEQGTTPVPTTRLPFTPRMKRILHMAVEEARSRGQEHVGPEHLLLALVRESDGPAAHVLGKLGVGRDAVRVAVLELLAADADGPGSAPPP